MGNERVRREMARLVRDEFANNPLLVSRALREATDKKVSPRTVQSWLIEPGKSSSRTCPAWALKALTEFLSSPSGRNSLALWTDIYHERPDTPEEFRKTYERDAVAKATLDIEHDASALTAWENASMQTMARKLFEFERRTVAYLQFLHAQQKALLQGLERATSYEEMRTVVREAIRDRDSAEAYVLQTRRAIEAGTDEFAHSEGLEG